MKLGIDCDGVLANFSKAFIEEANHIWPGRLDPHYMSKSWNDLGGLTLEEQDQVWERVKATPNWWMRLDAFAENVAALQVFLYTHAHNDIILCTSRVPTAGDTVAFQTERWARACGLDVGHNYLGVVPIEHGNDKIKFYLAAGIEASIDDRGDSVEHFDAHDKGKHRAFLLDRPWNQDAVVKRRVKTMQEFFDLAQDVR